MRKRLVICGTQGAALVVADAVAAMGAYELVGFIGNSAGGSEDRADAMEISCRPILGDDDRLQALAEEESEQAKEYFQNLTDQVISF